MVGLKRDLNPMPPDIRERLEERGVMAAYAARPAHQRNDYLGWIARAKRPETKAKRLAQMLEQLRFGLDEP